MLAKNDINYIQLEGLKKRGYTSKDVDNLCKEVDDNKLSMKLVFNNTAQPEIVLSKYTWEKKQGHYIVMAEAFTDIFKKMDASQLKGSLVVWLDDGIWEHTQVLTRKAPVLTFGRPLQDYSSFLIPDPAFLGSGGYKKSFEEIIEYEAKIEQKEKNIFWRGAGTGIGIEGPNWRNLGRGKLVIKSKEINNKDILDAKITRVAHLSKERIEEMTAENVLTKFCDFIYFLNHKYLIDIDGYSCAWMSLYYKLLSSSLVLKIQSSYDQWYYNKLIPWKHYIPLTSNLAEIEEIYEWLINNDQIVDEIISEASLLMTEISYEKEEERLITLLKAILSCQKD